ncbi:uncharacterized protein [Miscanthus floridulus]|uniref:uncharacterized protein isoform X2 n=1 Tax=Miscanthus floridulus TaxID=154761 RepID=UPI00345936FC
MLMLPYLETHHHQEQLRTSTSCWTYKLLTSHLHQDSTLRKTPPKQTAVIPATIAGSSALAHDNVPKRLFGDTLLGNQDDERWRRRPQQHREQWQKTKNRCGVQTSCKN